MMTRRRNSRATPAFGCALFFLVVSSSWGAQHEDSAADSVVAEESMLMAHLEEDAQDGMAHLSKDVSKDTTVSDRRPGSDPESELSQYSQHAIELGQVAASLPPMLSPYICLGGMTSLVASTKDSYYCVQRSGYIKGPEKALIAACHADKTCTGYDYRQNGGYGNLCRQTSYPGRSRKCCGYKLCLKPSVSNRASPAPPSESAHKHLKERKTKATTTKGRHERRFKEKHKKTKRKQQHKENAMKRLRSQKATEKAIKHSHEKHNKEKRPKVRRELKTKKVKAAELKKKGDAVKKKAQKAAARARAAGYAAVKAQKKVTRAARARADSEKRSKRKQKSLKKAKTKKEVAAKAKKMAKSNVETGKSNVERAKKFQEDAANSVKSYEKQQTRVKANAERAKKDAVRAAKKQEGEMS